MAAEPRLLDLAGVDAFYGRSQALFDVSFSVGASEVVAILGRNGAGKTTTLRTIMGFNAPGKGTVRFAGELISGQKPHRIARRGISYVPETRDAFSLLTVEENIMLGYRPGSPFTLERFLRWFPELGGLTQRRGAQLSGGQQQMMVIGRGLAPGPQLLLLDEPSQGLAPVVVKSVARVLAELRGEKLAIVLVEQNLSFALGIADRIIVLENGGVVDSLTAEEGRRDAARIERYLAVH